MKSKYASNQAPTDMHVPRNDIAVQIPPGTKNQTIGADSSKDFSVDVQVSICIKETSGSECFSKM
jgi:hypothetical protein